MLQRKKRRKNRVSGTRPVKPYPEFPLTAHSTGLWCKAINGKTWYFGPWAKQQNGKLVRLPDDGWQDALNRYIDQRDDLYAGRTPGTPANEITVAGLCEQFLSAKMNLLDNGEIVPRTFSDYRRITERLISFFGKKRRVEDLTAADFENLRKRLSDCLGPVRLGSEIRQVKMIFKYGWDAGLIETPVRLGPNFKPPAKHVIRKLRNARAPKMFEPDEIRALIDAAGIQMRAMILLGVNGGFGNHDCGTLPLSAIDFSTGWVNFPRPKTGIGRRFPLWPRTVEALKRVLESRPKPRSAEAEGLVFVTKYGNPWAKQSSANPISGQFRRVSCTAGVCRSGVGFYALRHVFETIGGETRDQVAVNAIMGHVDGSMAAVYRERISDERIRAVTEYVGNWVFPGEACKSSATDDVGSTAEA